MGTFERGIVLPTNQQGPDWTTVRWPQILELARRAETPVVEAIRAD